jgi:hypothetical protein
MSSRIIYLWSGLSLLLGVLLTFVFTSIVVQTTWVTGTKVHTNIQSPILWIFLNLMVILGSVLILVGLLAVYIRLAKRALWLGMVGLVLTFVAILMRGSAT